MFYCDYCNKLIEIDDLIKMEKDEISESDKEWQVSEKTCMECREEIRNAREEFSSDNSPLHPDETVEEFEDHEDHDLK
ncbi:MAG TPA: hypothetical protein P5548_02810 [Candidatus Moranbacteria bacterium]|nr:hypothetical protein [Candidatus Moranbacteria bacterium]HRZ33799.1 hypothetical protein [Candidatus Moranbacteria bacterium]